VVLEVLGGAGGGYRVPTYSCSPVQASVVGGDGAGAGEDDAEREEGTGRARIAQGPEVSIILEQRQEIVHHITAVELVLLATLLTYPTHAMFLLFFT